MDKRVAIIGTSFRFPGTTPQTFWSDLLDHRDLVSEVESSRWSFDAFSHPDTKHPGTSYTFKAGSLGDVSGFDASFFGISPREASLMDPQQRLLLEMTWEAIENAGKPPSSLKGSDCGVFIGIASADYAYRFAEDLSIVDSSVATGNTSSIAANRISYLFDLHGPSIAMDTACSSSMVAFHQACQSIRSGETEQALAGGVSLHLHPYGFIAFSKATMLSKQGKCQVFDAEGDGYVRSEGGGIFLLKDYDAAIRDGDAILAVVAGSSVNTDGYKSGLTVPNPQAQAALMTAAYQKAGLSPEQLDYVEAHGTGTAVGDPIETRAISMALGKSRSTPLPIGSVKSNMGHLEAASGIAGLAKAIYCLKHREVPATISMKTPNPNIHFEDWNIRVVTENMPLPPEKTLTIGVNSFGFGGANAHVILQTAPEVQATPPAQTPSKKIPLIISARDINALEQSVRQAINLLETASDSFYTLAYNFALHREIHPIVHTIWAENCTDAAAQLSSLLTDKVDPFYNDTPSSRIAYVYSGNGCQWEKMGNTLLQSSEVFRAAVEQVDGYFKPLAGFSLIEELQGNNGEERLALTEIAQPALFALQVGLTELLRAHHVMPSAVTGHSVGEVASAWASGALTLEQAVHVIYYRSQHQGKTAGLGEMTAVGFDAQSTQALITELALTEVELAGINSIRGVTLAGNPDQLSQIESHLKQQGTFYRRLNLNYAFHSSKMDSVEEQIKISLSNLTPSTSQLPFYSTVSGDLLDGSTLTADYWWDNIRQPVLFRSAIDQMIADGYTAFIEIGAHPVLKSYLNDALRHADLTGLTLTTLTKHKDQIELIERTAAQVLICEDIKSSGLFAQPAEKIELPTYPWQRERLWHPESTNSIGLLMRQKQHDLLGYPVKQFLHTWENTLDTQSYPWLADHVVDDHVIFPGTGYIELLLAATHLNTPTEFVELEEIEIYNPLTLDNQHSKKTRVSLQPKSGEITISSRDLVEGEHWTKNAAGRFLKAPTPLHLSQPCPALPKRPYDLTLTDHLSMMMSVGLDYGPTFQAITHGWTEGDRVLGVFDPQFNQSSYWLHPAQLDCTFQLIIQFLKEQLNNNEGIAYVPVRVGRIFVRTQAKSLHVAQARLLKRSPHSITAEFDLFDIDGVHIASIKEARFKAIRVKKSATQRVDYLDYHLTGTPAQKLSATPMGLSPVLQDCLSSETLAKCQRYQEEIDPLFDALANAILTEHVPKLAGKGLFNSQCIAEFTEAYPESEPLLQCLIHSAAQSQLITETSEGWQITPQSDDEAIPANLIWQMMARDYPEVFAVTHALGRFNLQLSRWLEAPDQLPSVNLEAYDTLLHVRNTPLFAHDVASALIDKVQQLSAQANVQRLRILEVGVSSPEICRYFNEALDPKQYDVSFTSLNSGAINKAEHLQEEFPYLNVIPLLDMEEEQAPQHQLVIININGATLSDFGIMMRHLSVLMADNAHLILIVPTPSHWLELLMRSHPEWLTAGHSQQLSPSQWADLLAEYGIDDCRILEGYTTSQQQLVIGQYQRTEEIKLPITLEHWHVLTDNSDNSLFPTDGHNYQQSTFVSLSDFANWTLEACASWLTQNVSDNLLFAIGLQSSPTAQMKLQQINDRCKGLNNLFKAIETSGSEVNLWVLTRHVASLYPCDDPNASWEHHQSDDSAIWGFARTLMNESQHTRLHLIDLPKSLTTPVYQTLYAEYAVPSVEQELFIDQRGQRYAPRLRKNPVPSLQSSSECASTPAVSYYLGFETPGQLKSLKWYAKEISPLHEDQIRVDIKATGLNFRDVMYTLGMLSDEAIENGFAGPTLGLEFAGIVTAVGNKISDYQLGDTVVGFGPASFSDSVVTQPNAIAHIPEGISFEAASTIPSTFFTVYYALHYLSRLEPGEKILIHGAAGGVGIAAIQVAQWIGAEIYATAGSESKRDFLRMMGVEHIYDSRSLTFAEEILLDTNEVGVDVVLNSLAGEAINQNLRVLKPFGRFLELGKRDFYENTQIGLRPFRNNISYFGIDADQLMQSKPELTHRLFQEMMGLFQDGTLYPLPYTLFDANHVVDAFRYMQQAKQIGKIVIGYDQPIRPKQPVTTPPSEVLTLEPNASYLVTGGLAGFGLKTAQWLVSKGARHLVLISRSGLGNDNAVEAVQQLEAQGINVLACACDVSNRDSLAELLDNSAEKMPPIKGVVHAAAVIEDSLAMNLSQEQLERVLTPKIAGALWLDELTDHLDLSFFVLYSSATTLLGNPGQSSYVAANHWLEGLAADRIRRGKPATCPRWGAIDDVGFLARNEKIKDALQSRIGGQALPSDKALEALEQMLLHGIGSQGVLEFEWGPLSRFLPSAAQPKFREIALANPDNDQNEDNRLDINELLAMSDDELTEKLLSLLKAELSKILMTSEDKLDPNRSMYDMGLDSLMGVELMSAIESKLGISVSVMALSETPTLGKLSHKLMNQLRGEQSDEDEMTKQVASQHLAEEDSSV